MTGNLTGFYSEVKDFEGRDLLIIDDIMDNGGTFLGLVKELRRSNCGSISLYVTHLIASKGLGHFAGIIDEIYTTSSFRRDVEKVKDGGVKLTVIKV